MPTRVSFTGQYSYATGDAGKSWQSQLLLKRMAKQRSCRHSPDVFAQADSIVPGMHPIDFDRFAYVRNSPYYHS
jgi:hypothetical protein